MKSPEEMALLRQAALDAETIEEAALAASRWGQFELERVLAGRVGPDEAMLREPIIRRMSYRELLS